MTWFDNLKSKNVDEFAKWLDENCLADSAPWHYWFGKKYCNNCETIRQQTYHNGLLEHAWCELNNNRCKFFIDMEEIPCGVDLIKMWLNSDSN